MPFISRGVTVGFARLDEKPLASILEELVAKRFTGRVEFDAVCAGSRIAGAVELSEGSIIAAEIEAPRLLKGVEALEQALQITTECRGYAEIIELSKDKVTVDLADNPDARLDPAKARELLSKSLEAVRKPAEEAKEVVEKRVEEVAAPPKPERPVEAAVAEETPTAPLVSPPPEAEKVEARVAPEEIEEKLKELSIAPSSKELIAKIDSSLFDAIIVLRGAMSETGAVSPSEVPQLLEKIVSISKRNEGKVTIAFVNDRLNEIKGKIVTYNGVIVAVLVKRGDRTLVDRDAVGELARFQRSLLYSIYVVDPAVDEELHKLVEDSYRKFTELQKARVEAEERHEEKPSTQETREEHREEHRMVKKRRLFPFFRKR